MSTISRSISLWSPSDQVVIPPSESTPSEIVEYGKSQLSTREMRSIVSAFASESYEMVATFVWTKAAAVLKKQLATLGMEFVGEMLGRQDLDDDSDPSSSLADHEAISLAEDLGMITSTQAMRLKHALDLVNHFANLEQAVAEQEAMEKEEAVSLLKNCIASILGKPRFETAIQFAEFRRSLGETTFKADDDDVQAINASPYFFVRTTLSVLLTLVKTSKGATQEHALGNAALSHPASLGALREPEKWQVGQAYAEVNSTGDRAASSSLKKALLQIRGFDFVPESLRSRTFTEAAAKVLAAHFAYNNFYGEQEPMQVLANLGTAIPKPAFGKCMEAVLAVWLGNRWGFSFASQEHAKQLLGSLRTEQWEYYLNECLQRDRTVLDKLANDISPMKRWKELVVTYRLHTMAVRVRRIKDFVAACGSDASVDSLQKQASKLRNMATKE